ncbi:hypothetical protein BH23CHL2_BH23CHL2_27500 [soil metagenome]
MRSAIVGDPRTRPSLIGPEGQDGVILMEHDHGIESKHASGKRGDGGTAVTPATVADD